jgi:hypothetical protein
VELRTAVLALKSWTAPEVDSPVIWEFALLLKMFRAKRFKMLWRGSGDDVGRHIEVSDCT